MKTRYVTEMGMGTDVHGRDYTLAAERAVFDAIHHLRDVFWTENTLSKTENCGWET